MGGFVLPPLTLLDPPKAERKIDERELMEAARLLEEKCREFSVEGSVVQIHPGPVVTTFEFKPDAGVKYSKVTGLSDDLCLAMRAESVLIDRIPGKSTVGIQIPNPNREAISLRELLESEAYTRTASRLTFALGKTIHGEPFMADLATMPHLLIAGSTGTGKSVGLNSMLTSLLYRATPDDVRLIMIDPKRLELGMYEDIPHLLSPVVVDPKKAANALRWAVREMEERYKTLAAFGVRNIEQFNRNVRAMLEAKETPQEGEPTRPLPFIVVVVDELADLMMVAGNEVEESICRLAQMARAVGIHLILATQRPSVDVITGLIKANLPSRISFRVSSKIDSRTILDSNGAEQLLGKGDMLFLPPASSRHVRLHGPYISEQESARLASFLRKQGKPTFDESITADDKKGGPEDLEFDKDELYDEGRAHRGAERTGLDLLPAAQDAHWVQPRRAAGRHDGSRRPGLARHRRQGPRGARGPGLLRRSGRATAMSEPAMPSRITLVACLALACVALAPPSASAQSARVRYETALEREAAVRGRLEKAGDPRASERTAILRQVTRAVATYEGIVRRYPTNGYCDNALWQGGRLSEAAYRRFGRADDRAKALQLYTWLVREYPSSSLVRRARTQVDALENLRSVEAALPPAAVSEPAPAPPPPAAPPAEAPRSIPVPIMTAAGHAPAPSVAGRGPAVLGEIQRAVLEGSVRVTLQLDREVQYHEERITAPDRVFFDLRNARLSEPLVDTVITYADDIVTQIRTGRHPDDTVRVVLDLDGVARYSVFTLYNPFRIVVDFERAPGAAAPKRATITPPVRVATDSTTDATAGSGVAPAVAAGPSNDGESVPPPAPAVPASNGPGGFSLSRQLGLSVSRIVIDPGHGGHDPGTTAHGIKEAELTLDVALRLEKLLAAEPGVEVVLTRRTNVYIPLEERTAIANRENADLFLSIHANASRNTAAHGIETYYLSFASSPEAEAVAARENSASESGMHNLPDIIKAIALNNKLDESRDLAAMVQESMVTRLRKAKTDLRNRGVKKAPFVVLIGAGMPSVLAEMSFLTNRKEAQLLKTGGYKDRIAEALHDAVIRYRRALKRQSTIADRP
ncbi:MAG: DNA translocase FtsK [Vicinamibacterales bacterium]